MAYFRKIRTHQERKNTCCHFNFIIVDEYRIKCRLKRSFSMLPEYRDEIFRTTQRSWKVHRKHQYKIKS